MFDWLSSRLKLRSKKKPDVKYPVGSVQSYAYDPRVMTCRESFEGDDPYCYQKCDYWYLRHLSVNLYHTNHFAQGLIDRFVTNVIHTGLVLEATPDEMMLGFNEGDLESLSADVESRFDLWASDPIVCHEAQQRTFQQAEADILRRAMYAGDELIVLRRNKKNGMPLFDFYDSACVCTPFHVTLAKSHTIDNGVELDSKGRQVAYWVVQKNGDFQRVSAFSEHDRRRKAWLYYGSPKRVGQRGLPLLAISSRILKGLERYRQSAQNKAQINAKLVFCIERKDATALPTSPLTTGGARRRSTHEIPCEEPKGHQFRAVDIGQEAIVLEGLNVGESPKIFDSKGVDEKYGDFEKAILQSFAWSNELPPEVVMLSFDSNYSASAGAKDEARLTFSARRKTAIESFNKPVYRDFFISLVALDKISAPGFMASLVNPRDYEITQAWLSASWFGVEKQSQDFLKTARAVHMLLADGLIDHEEASRRLGLGSFSRNIKRIPRQVEKLDALRFARFEKELVRRKQLADRLGIALSELPQQHEEG